MSGRWPATTDVWIFVSSSLPLAKVWKTTVAPVCFWNAADTSLNHCCCCAPYLPSALIRTVSVLPVPSIGVAVGVAIGAALGVLAAAIGVLVEALGLFVAVDPLHAVTTSAVMASAAVSVVNLVLLVSMPLLLLWAASLRSGDLDGHTMVDVVWGRRPLRGERGRTDGRRSGHATLRKLSPPRARLRHYWSSRSSCIRRGSALRRRWVPACGSTNPA